MKISIEVGPQNITIVQGTQSGNNINIKNYVTVKTPPYIINDGEITNVDLLYSKIKNAISHAHIHGSSVSISINSTTIITREMLIPKSTTAQAIKMISMDMFQSKGLTSSYTVDYAITDEIKENGTVQYRVLAVAVPEHIVKNYVLLCEMLGYRREYIDINFNAIYKTFAVQPSIVAKENPVIIASIGTASADFIVLERGKISFTKTLSLNISKYINLTSDKATIDFSKVDLGDTAAQSRQMLVDAFIYDIAQEVSKVIQFEYSRSNHTTIDDVFLCGAITEVGGVEERLSALLDANIKVVSMPFCFKTKLNFKYSQFVGVIGGLIRLK